MIYLLAIIGLLALTYLAWRAFGPDAEGGETRGPAAPIRRPTKRGPVGPVGPDDDLEFLKDLERKSRNKNPKFNSDGDDHPTSTD